MTHWTHKMTPKERTAYFKDIRKKVKNPGFAGMDKDKHKAISSKGGWNKWHKDEINPQEPGSQS